MKKVILLAAMSVIPALAGAQIEMVKNGSPVSRIVVVDNDSASFRAANLLNKFVKRISGATLPLSDGKMKKANDIVIGGRAEGVGEDGFVLECSKKQLRITSGGGSGSINGVVRLLEKYMGCDYFSYKEWSCQASKNIRIPAMKVSDEPAFSFRQTQCYALQDPDYVDWFAMENQSQIFADNLWVHTFNRLLPSDKYGKAHPEYYALINGERRPGTHSQWCLTNPEVFEVVCHNVDSIFKANPGMKMISVSQNDGNDTYCHCPKCKAVDDYEGSPSGNIIRFLNKLAARFPDKQFSTLAYLFSMQPPRHTKPLPNVNIMLCDIDCKREVPLTDNASGRNFMKALTGWSAITNNIFIWDYVINFDNYIAPFPNFHILQKNIQTFNKNHARMLFEQAGSPIGTDLCELRQYMITKLMWNPYQDADSLMQHFLNGYYGKAAPELYQYIKIMQGGLVASRVPLWIYDSPVSHKDGMLYFKRHPNVHFQNL